MNMLNCPECGGHNPASETMCDHCGFSLEGARPVSIAQTAPSKQCGGCGKPVTHQMRFCDGCGTPLQTTPSLADAGEAVLIKSIEPEEDGDLAGNTIIDVPPPTPEPEPEPATVLAASHTIETPTTSANSSEPETPPAPLVVTPPPPPPIEIETPPSPEPVPVAAAVAVPQEDRQWKLVCVEGFRMGKEYLLYKSLMLLGRVDPDNGIFPELELEDQDDGYVSRRHAQIRIEGGRVTVEDLGGENGTFVEGRPIPAFHPVEVTSGQVIRLGKVGLMLKPHHTS